MAVIRPEYLFICGAIGSGNTFMFNCLSQDSEAYGINEDALGATLERLMQSEREMGKCPHSVDAYRGFLRALRKDRKTLILKTPSNLRRVPLLRREISGSRFILMIREPHAAIVSGLERADLNVEKVARQWLEDWEHFQSIENDTVVVTFEQLAVDPDGALNQVATIYPVAESVLTYAQRMNRPERSGGARWKTKVDDSTQADVEQWVARLGLTEKYRAVAEAAAGGTASRTAAASVDADRSMLVRMKKAFYRGYYRLAR